VGELSNWCIQNFSCYDLQRAKDFMRTYACDFFDILKDAYGGLAWNREYEVAVEAIDITIKCWDNFNVVPSGESWRETLMETIPQYLGHPLRGEPQDKETASTPSPLLVIYQAHANRASEQKAPMPITSRQPEPQREVARRTALLSAYKAATGASNKKIYEAQNSGIYKPQFYQWLDGRLSANSVTAKNFEAFLKARKRPIPRRPTI